MVDAASGWAREGEQVNGIARRANSGAPSAKDAAPAPTTRSGPFHALQRRSARLRRHIGSRRAESWRADGGVMKAGVTVKGRKRSPRSP